MSADRERVIPDIQLACEPPTLRIVERLDEPIEAPGECRLHQGRPCLLFDDWDYAEDWSGEYVRVIEPQVLSSAATLTISEFWTLVRQVHAVG